MVTYKYIYLENSDLPPSGRRHFSQTHSSEWRFVPGKMSFPGRKNKLAEDDR